MENVEVEIWKDVSGYEGLYRASNLGRIKSLKRYKYSTKKILKEKILNPGRNKGGYLIVALSKNGKQNYFLLHRIIGQTFLGSNINNPKECICHKDDNTLNNNINNLWIGTHKENMQDRNNKNRHVDNKGEFHGNHKLTIQDVKTIKIDLLTQTYEQISKKFLVCRGTIGHIKAGRSWKHIIQ